MIARVWRGYSSPAHADTYEAMLKPELLPGLSRKQGFRGSYLLRRDAGDEIEFLTIILWESLDDVRAAAGAEYEVAIVPEERRPYLTRWDEQAAHYEIASVQQAAIEPPK
jgi:heme-degrading monooxygenase HmoA